MRDIGARPATDGSNLRHLYAIGLGTAALTYVGCRFNGACCRSAGNVINDAGGLLLLLLLLLLMETGTLTTTVGGALDRSLVTMSELMMSTRSVRTIARFTTLRRAYRRRHLKT